jgi:hypothetical protein
MLIGDAVLRSNRRYRLVPLDHLGQEDRLLAEDGGAGLTYGLLQPAAGSGLEPRAVSTDTALLLFTLRKAGRCPEYVRRALGDRLDRTLGRLIMDGILEVEVEGTFRSGWPGWAPFAGGWAPFAGGWAPFADGAPSSVPARTAQLSVAALRHGQALLSVADVPVELVASRLYMYGRLPVTPRLRRTLPSDAAVARSLGIRSSRVAATLRTAWRQDPVAEASPWRSWRPRGSAGHASRRRTYKLYISPTIEGLAEACAVVASELAGARGVVGFKVARTVEGLVRPDKLVAYFDDLDALHDGAARVREAAGSCAPQGVPFTAAVTADGLLSWAIDPPRSGGRGGGTPVSWRSWVTERLAEHLVAARGEASREAEPWQVALARVALDGVDPATWMPELEIFDRATAGAAP